MLHTPARLQLSSSWYASWNSYRRWPIGSFVDDPVPQSTRLLCGRDLLLGMLIILNGFDLVQGLQPCAAYLSRTSCTRNAMENGRSSLVGGDVFSGGSSPLGDSLNVRGSVSTTWNLFSFCARRQMP